LTVGSAEEFASCYGVNLALRKLFVFGFEAAGGCGAAADEPGATASSGQRRISLGGNGQLAAAEWPGSKRVPVRGAGSQEGYFGIPAK
jgi:hypothetical protein